MSDTAALIATAISAAATLTTQIATLQADILTAGDLDNATVDAITGLHSDAAAAITTAGSLEAAHEAILEIAAQPAQLAGGQAPAVLLANFNQLLVATSAEPVAFDTLNRLTRVQLNLTAIGT